MSSGVSHSRQGRYSLFLRLWIGPTGPGSGTVWNDLVINVDGLSSKLGAAPD